MGSKTRGNYPVKASICPTCKKVHNGYNLGDTQLLIPKMGKHLCKDCNLDACFKQYERKLPRVCRSEEMQRVR